MACGDGLIIVIAAAIEHSQRAAVDDLSNRNSATGVDVDYRTPLPIGTYLAITPYLDSQYALRKRQAILSRIAAILRAGMPLKLYQTAKHKT